MATSCHHGNTTLQEHNLSSAQNKHIQHARRITQLNDNVDWCFVAAALNSRDCLWDVSAHNVDVDIEKITRSFS